MKYEPVFGDQLAFDGMMPDCEFIVGTYGYKIKDGKCFYCEKYNHKYGWSPTGDAVKALSPVIAMRRIIPEPKRWTVEDQKAGRLPEVGSLVEYFVNNEHDDTEVTAQWRNGDELEILRGQNKNKAFVVFNKRTEQSSNLIINCINPIETPEEKAQRLREEWVDKATFMTTYEIYDELLSGDLPVPSAPEQNK